MISKNKKLFLKIYIPFVIITIIALIVLQILGSKKRIGYLTEFNLNIERMLNLYDLESIIEDFTVDGKLDEESIKNYLLNNENITNYVHHFRIRYYDKFFRNNDIYGVYPDLSNLPDYMENAEMEYKGSPYGNFISDRETIEIENIDINYILKIKPKIPILLYFILALILIRKLNISNDKKFIIITIFIALILFIFQFWLGFPGYFLNIDVLCCMYQALNNSYNNWHPVIISLTLHFLYKIFGYHSYYLFIINLFLFHLGIILIIISLYYKFKTKAVILLYLLILIKEIFFTNFAGDKDATASLFVCLLYSLIFFQLSMPINNRYIRLFIKIFTAIILLFGLLWRHNMIVIIYPIFILFTYLLLKNKNIKNIKNYIKSFVILMLMWAIILICIVKIFPMIFEDIKTYPTKHLFLLQIVACVVPENDDSLIPNEWYIDGKTFEDIKQTYNDNPTFADRLSLSIDVPLPNLKKIWIKCMLKYPINYIKHISRFLIAYLTTRNYYPILNSNSIQKGYEQHLNSICGKTAISRLNTNEQKIVLTPFRKKTYDFLFNNMINITMIFPVIISFIIFIINFILIFTKRIFDSNLLIYSFSVSLSAIATYIIVSLFVPTVTFRYIYPVYPISIISLISFLTFIKELRGEKK